MRDEMNATLRIYNWPSQAFWRCLEVRTLKPIEYERPILEIGCGDGRLSALIFREIDEGIDSNPRSIEKCRRLSGGLYRVVSCRDARELPDSPRKYATVFANCVMEHISNVDAVLASCSRALRPSGKLVMTVPLIRMNQHLLFPWRWYSKMRQRQLFHINLFPKETWEAKLCSAGFQRIEFRSYLSGEACRFWDSIDAPGSLGFGRYHVAAVLGRSAAKLLPARVKDWSVDRLSEWLAEKVEASKESGAACAVVAIAHKPDEESSQ